MALGDKTRAGAERGGRMNSGIDPSASSSGVAFGFFLDVSQQGGPVPALALGEPPWAFLFCS